MELVKRLQTMTAHVQFKDYHTGSDPTQPLVAESNMDGEAKVATGASVNDNAHEETFNSIKPYRGKEWSAVEHLLKVPDDSEIDDQEECSDYDFMGSPSASEVSSDSHDDPLAEDIHELVNVLDNVIRSNSNLSCDATPIVEYLDLDIFRYETMLEEVRNWGCDVEMITDDTLLEAANEQ